MTSAVPPALEVRGLWASHPGLDVLRGVDLAVGPGELTAVLGASGCGKTTLLRVIAGFHPADAGEVRLAGRPMARVGAAPGPDAGADVDVVPERRGVGIVPQEGALFEHLTVAGNVAFGLPRARRAAPERRERVREMLELVELPDLADRRPAELSGGQQQRVALARALAPAPALVLLDEPFAALDAALRAELRAQVRAVLRAAGTAAVLVTHDQQEALGTADHLVVLRGGRVVADGTPRAVYDAPRDVGVAGFVGEAAILPATLTRGTCASPLGPIALGGTDGPGQIVVRPEQLALARWGGAGGRVLDVVFHGHASTVVVALAVGEGDGDGNHGSVRVRLGRADPVPAVGEPVRVVVLGTPSWFPGGGAGGDSASW